MRTNTFTNILIAAFCAGMFCSCKKSDEVSSSDSKNAAQAAKDSVAQWASTNQTYLQSNKDVAGAVRSFSNAFYMGITNEVSLEAARALLFVKQLHDKDRLPGISKDEHGEMKSDDFDMVISNKAAILLYPLRYTFHLVKTGDFSTNNYTLVKQTKDGEWKLRRAWETDSNGQIIQEWPVQ
jgi:hypothetical protein